MLTSFERPISCSLQHGSRNIDANNPFKGFRKSEGETSGSAAPVECELVARGARQAAKNVRDRLPARGVEGLEIALPTSPSLARIRTDGPVGIRRAEVLPQFAGEPLSRPSNSRQGPTAPKDEERCAGSFRLG